MKIQAFRAWRPKEEFASQVASPPYDVVDQAQARAIAGENPRSFLRVTRPDLECSDGTAVDAPECYEKASVNFRRLCREGTLFREADPGLYIYRLIFEGRAQTGLVAACAASDYDAAVIKKHELTRARPEADRTRHILSTGAQTGPVFLAFRDRADIEARLRDAALHTRPLYDFHATGGVQHTIWKAEHPDEWVRLFGQVPAAYIADGHHRAAAACRIARDRAAAQPAAPPDAPWRYFLGVLFPASHLRILPYHRVVADLNGRSPEAFLEALRTAGFEVEPSEAVAPHEAGTAGLFTQNRWWSMRWPIPSTGDRASRLDAAVLQTRVLAPLLDIQDPRQSDRIAFVGGIHGIGELERRVRGGHAAAAFAMVPVHMNQLMEVADGGGIMPPKSTWFEPKLRDGLLVHALDD